MLNSTEDNFCLTRGKERFNTLMGQNQYPDWALQSLIPYNEELGYLHYTHYHFKEVKMNSIIGSAHTDYNGLGSWLEFLGALKKTNSTESLIARSIFFKEDKKTNDALLLCYKNKYWIKDGNNRICIAKFVGIESIIVPVTEYFYE